MVRGLKFCINEEEELYYLCSESKGADQLRGYREADLRLCFRICKKTGFLMTRLILQIPFLAIASAVALPRPLFAPVMTKLCPVTSTSRSWPLKFLLAA